MFTITSDIYKSLAEEILQKIVSNKIYSGTILLEYNDVEIKFISTLIPFFSREKLIDEEYEALIDLVPVWWDIQITSDNGLEISDFDYDTLKYYICQ